MCLSSFTNHGLRVLMASAPGLAFSTTERADQFGLSRNHLTRITPRRAKGGMTATRRAGGAGATLARDPTAITVGSVVRLLEKGQSVVECLAAKDGTCSITGFCRLPPLYRAGAAIMAALDRALAYVVLAAGSMSHVSANAEL